jgi:hypothetical protein
MQKIVRGTRVDARLAVMALDDEAKRDVISDWLRWPL